MELINIKLKKNISNEINSDNILEQKWINIQKKLPNHGDIILAYGLLTKELETENNLHNSEKIIAKVIYCDTIIPPEWIVCDTCYYTSELKDVTHWCILPPIPNEYL